MFRDHSAAYTISGFGILLPLFAMVLLGFPSSAVADGTSLDAVRAAHARGLVAAPSPPDYIEGSGRQRPDEGKVLPPKSIPAADGAPGPSDRSDGGSAREDSGSRGREADLVLSSGEVPVVPERGTKPGPVGDPALDRPVGERKGSGGDGPGEFDTVVIGADGVSVISSGSSGARAAALVATIQYLPDSFGLDRADRKILGQIVALQRQYGAAAVRVVGHAPAHDMSRRRAVGVASVLHSMGIPDSMLDVSSVVYSDVTSNESMPYGSEALHRAEVWFDY